MTLKSKTHQIDIIVPVYNASNFALNCLESVHNSTNNVKYRLIIINDGSDTSTSKLLTKFSKNHNEKTVLLEHESNFGYTKAVNTGLKFSKAPYAVLLNSDTIVTNNWLNKLISCFEENNELGIIGPLSNAASWQSIPQLFDDTGQFSINNLPDGMNANEMALMVEKISLSHFPEVSFVNGFCFMIKRAVIDSIGYMDEDAFPLGYGEENDYCIRAKKAGFKLAIADNTYIYHAKSKSFGHEKRKVLSKEGSDKLKEKYGADFFNKEADKMRNIPALNAFRQKLKHKFSVQALGNLIDRNNFKVLFVLPKPGIGGGSHSVVQEVMAMRQMGIDAGIAVEQRHTKMLYKRYDDIDNIKDLFIGYEDHNLLEKAAKFDVVIATIFHSTNLVKFITDSFPHILAGYYIQDYEPLFFDEPNQLYDDALASYNRLENGLLFAKTNWIAREVERFHGVSVQKVKPSIDHDVYFPSPPHDTKIENPIRIAAMIRPRTPRRGANRTMDLLANIKHRYKNQIDIHLFGCEQDEQGFLSLNRDFNFKHHGILMRSGVADVLRNTDIFIDLSDYQAFGRTSLEAMACGATAMVPLHGGGDEYAIDGKNALVVDTFNLIECEERLVGTIEDPILLDKLKTAALVTSKEYSPQIAANSELELIQEALSLHRENFPKSIEYTDIKLKTKKELPKEFTATSMRNKRLWRKFRMQPKQYFEDSSVIGFKYLSFFFKETTRSQLQADYQKSTSEINNLRRHIEQIKNNAKNDIKTESDRLTIKIHEINSKYQKIKNKQLILTTELNDTHIKLNQEKDKNYKINDELKDILNELKKANHQISELSLENNKLNKQVSDQGKHIEAQEIQQSLLEKKISEITAQIHLFKELLLKELRPTNGKNDG